MRQLHVRNMHLLKQKEKKQPVWNRVKTVCIAVLFVCNVVLLAVSGCMAAYDAYVSHQTSIRMDDMLAGRGIVCGSSVYTVLEDYPEVYTVRADTAWQEAFARGLLDGTVTARPEKGNTMVWEGGNGSVSWTASGHLNAQIILYGEPELTAEDQAQKQLRRVLSDAGLDIPTQWMETTATDSGFSVKIRQELEGVELLGGGLTAELTPQNQLTITGSWCTGEPEQMNVRALETYSAEKVLFQLTGGELTFTQIISVQPVYVLSDKSGGRFTTIPCWRFSTDSGDYVLNILTGDVVASADLNPEQSTEDDSVQPDSGETEAMDTETEPVEDPALPDVDIAGEQDIAWDEER